MSGILFLTKISGEPIAVTLAADFKIVSVTQVNPDDYGKPYYTRLTWSQNGAIQSRAVSNSVDEVNQKIKYVQIMSGVQHAACQ